MRLQIINYPNLMTANFNYFGIGRDHRLTGKVNLLPTGAALSNFSYA